MSKPNILKLALVLVAIAAVVLLVKGALSTADRLPSRPDRLLMFDIATGELLSIPLPRNGTAVPMEHPETGVRSLFLVEEVSPHPAIPADVPEDIRAEIQAELDAAPAPGLYLPLRYVIGAGINPRDLSDWIDVETGRLKQPTDPKRLN